MSTAWMNESDDGWIWDPTVGGRVGLIRYGTGDVHQPEGWQFDVEAAGFPRLNLEEGVDFDSVDFRVGTPLSWRRGPVQFKLSYYHLSAHAGDEFLERHPGFQRINYSRDAIVVGMGYFPWPDLRLYGEVGYAFATDGGSEPWEVQFGLEHAPVQPTGLRGAPFLAMNVHLREEVDFGGSFTTMAGWAWRGERTGHLLRTGVQYFNGKSSQRQFFNESEELLGLGIWYDY